MLCCAFRPKQATERSQCFKIAFQSEVTATFTPRYAPGLYRLTAAHSTACSLSCRFIHISHQISHSKA